MGQHSEVYDNLIHTQKISLEHRLKHTAKINAFSRINHIVIFDRLIYFLESLLTLHTETTSDISNSREFLKTSISQVEKITEKVDVDQKVTSKKIDTVLENASS